MFARDADAVDVPHTTARDWVRRFRERASLLWSGFPPVAVELGGDVAARRSTNVEGAAFVGRV